MKFILGRTVVPEDYSYNGGDVQKDTRLWRSMKTTVTCKRDVQKHTRPWRDNDGERRLCQVFCWSRVSYMQLVCRLLTPLVFFFMVLSMVMSSVAKLAFLSFFLINNIPNFKVLWEVLEISIYLELRDHQKICTIFLFMIFSLCYTISRSLISRLNNL